MGRQVKRRTWLALHETDTDTDTDTDTGERVKRTQPRSAPPHPVTGTVRRLLCAAIISEMTGAAQRSVISAAPQHRPESANHMRDLPNETDGEPGATYSRPPIAISHGRGAHGCRWKVPARTGSGAELPRLPRQEPVS